MILVLLGAKWMGSVVLLQILAVGSLFSPLTMLNLNLLYIKGRTDKVLKLEFIKKPLAFLILFSTVHFGVVVLCIGKVLYDMTAFSINSYYTQISSVWAVESGEKLSPHLDQKSGDGRAGIWKY